MLHYQSPANAAPRSALASAQTAAAIASLMLAACGGAEASLLTGDGAADDTGDVPADIVDEAASEGNPARSSSGVGAELEIPGFQRAAYPAAPYGFAAGTTVSNLDFLGWMDPVASSFDASRVSEVRMSDFYNPGPRGEGLELLMVNAVAVWCGACRLEYDEFSREQVYAEFNPRGLEMIGVLFEDSTRGPAGYSDLEMWAATFDVPFPFVVDPGFKTGAFFDRSATPMNMIVDARTMQIIATFVGWDPEIFTDIDNLLRSRGR